MTTPEQIEQRWWTHLLDDTNFADLRRNVDAKELFGIVDETAGGIVAYALSEDLADAIVHTLNAVRASDRVNPSPDDVRACLTCGEPCVCVDPDDDESWVHAPWANDQADHTAVTEL